MGKTLRERSSGTQELGVCARPHPPIFAPLCLQHLRKFSRYSDENRELKSENVTTSFVFRILNEKNVLSAARYRTLFSVLRSPFSVLLSSFFVLRESWGNYPALAELGRSTHGEVSVRKDEWV